MTKQSIQLDLEAQQTPKDNFTGFVPHDFGIKPANENYRPAVSAINAPLPPEHLPACPCQECEALKNPILDMMKSAKAPATGQAGQNSSTDVLMRRRRGNGAPPSPAL